MRVRIPSKHSSIGVDLQTLREFLGLLQVKSVQAEMLTWYCWLTLKSGSTRELRVAETLVL